MGGPRVTSGEDSKQDYGTPADFLDSSQVRFGNIVFDLAAHRLNKKNPKYFAPEILVEKVDCSKKIAPKSFIVETLVSRGASLDEATEAVDKALPINASGNVTISVRNRDPDAAGLDSFKQNWANVSTRYHSGGRAGLLWLNCEFSDITPWATKCREEAERGANILLLTPAMVGANWYRDNIAGHADVYHLNGRLCFDGKNVFPKDCMVSHFYPRCRKRIFVWDWKKGILHHAWTPTTDVNPGTP